jgi:integral membrane protein
MGRLEGISYLLLLLIAMPLKYWAGEPMAVKVIGMAHGVLFIGFGLLVLMAANKYKMTPKHVNWGIIASLLPFGTFVYESKVLHLYTETQISPLKVASTSDMLLPKDN